MKKYSHTFVVNQKTGLCCTHEIEAKDAKEAEAIFSSRYPNFDKTAMTEKEDNGQS